MNVRRLFIVVVSGLSLAAGLVFGAPGILSAAEEGGQKGPHHPHYEAEDTMLAIPQAMTAPTSLVITGPSQGFIDISYTFTATVSPSDATQPISYTWEATGHAPIVHTGGLTDTLNFAWSVTGTQTITVTATNAEGEVTNTHNITTAQTLCNQVLSKTSFEEAFIADVWKFPASGAGVPKPGGVQWYVSGGHTGTRSLRNVTFEGDYFTPHFYQQFTMPDWVISTTTTFDLNLYKQVGNLSNGPDPNDEFYVMVVTTNEPNTWTALTDPELVAQGVQTSGWVPFTARLTLASGINLEDYANQNLYFYFFNNSNPTISSTTCGSLCQSEFFFDDINLNICTTSLSTVYLPLVLR